jgi:hypothetical protein
MKILLSVSEAPPLAGWEALAREFPTVAARQVMTATQLDRIVEVLEWRSPAFDPLAFDRRVGDAASGPMPPVLLVGDNVSELQDVASAVLTRLQGRLNRRNTSSANAAFDAVLAAHRSKHDLVKPLVRADYNHALDAWQWVLRLAPEASIWVQLAALFHDIERLTTDAERRVENYAIDDQAFKDARAKVGATTTRAMLIAVGLHSSTIERTCKLIAEHDRTDAEAEHALLNDADALSFFSLDSAGFLTAYGVEPARRRIEYSLSRLRSPARQRLRQIRLRADVAALVRDQLGAER